MSSHSTLRKKAKNASLALIIGLPMMAFVGLQISSERETKVFRDVNRTPSSVNRQQPSQIMRTHKLSRPMIVRIEKQDTLGVEPNEPFTLRGIFSATVPQKQMSIKWILPKNVEVLSGRTEEDFLDVEPGIDYESQIVLVSNAEKNQKIHFRVENKTDEQHFSMTAQYNTIDQEIINLEKDQLAKRAREYEKNQRKKIKVIK